MTTYEPGTVAMVSDPATMTRKPAILIGHDPAERCWHSAERNGDLRCLADDAAEDVRPLVVLDLEYPAGLVATLRDALSHMLRGGPNHGRLSGLIAEIEAQTRPPKPAEPTGLGAIVVDADSEPWVRHADGKWSCLKSAPGIDVCTWDELVEKYGPLEVQP